MLENGQITISPEASRALQEATDAFFAAREAVRAQVAPLQEQALALDQEVRRLEEAHRRAVDRLNEARKAVVQEIEAAVGGPEMVEDDLRVGVIEHTTDPARDDCGCP